jgi:transglutaminase-like putative cysteine protease
MTRLTLNVFVATRRRLICVFSLMLAMLMVISSCSAGGVLDNGKPELGVANPGEQRDNTPYVHLPEQPMALVSQDGLALIDYSNYRRGYFSAKVFVDGYYKVLVDAPDGAQYQYTIREAEKFINVPFSCGNGRYTLGFFQNIEDNRFSTMFSVNVDVELDDQLLPFLYPSQYVSFTPDDRAVALSQEVTQGASSEIEAINAIYLWCVMSLKYDHDKARTVQPGYLPNNDDTLDTRKGICFDYAVLCASMMRAQRLPTRLEIGYCGDVYHAWISVYTTEHGVIRRSITFDPETWTLLDPTIDSTGKTQLGLGPLMVDPDDYQPLFFY